MCVCVSVCWNIYIKINIYIYIHICKTILRIWCKLNSVQLAYNWNTDDIARERNMVKASVLPHRRIKNTNIFLGKINSNEVSYYHQQKRKREAKRKLIRKKIIKLNVNTGKKEKKKSKEKRKKKNKRFFFLTESRNYLKMKDGVCWGLDEREKNGI